MAKKHTPPPKSFSSPHSVSKGNTGVMATEVYARASAEGVVADAPAEGASLDEKLSMASKLVDELKALKSEALEARSSAVREREQAEKLRRDAREELAKVEIDRKAAADAAHKARDERTELEILRAKTEGGFIEERRRLLAPVEQQLEALRLDRTRLLSDLEKKRAEGESTLAEDLERARREGLSSLQRQLAEDRAAHDAALERENATHDARRAESEERVATALKSLAERERELRRENARLETERALLAEDQENLEAKVARFAAARIAELESQLASERLRSASIVSQRDHFHAELEKHRELELQLRGRPVSALLEELQVVTQARESLESELRTRPSTAQSERLAELERAREEWESDRLDLTRRLASERSRAASLERDAVAEQALKQLLEIKELRLQNQETAIEQLKTEVGQLTEASESQTPFKALDELDRNPSLQTKVRTDNPFRPGPDSLRAFVTDLRERMAGALSTGNGARSTRLDYSEADLRCWLGGLAMSRLVLLQGISGTGKTSLPRAFAQAIGGEACVIPVQAGWRDRQDLVGYFNAFQKRYYATEFLKALYQAGTPAHRDRPFIIVLDEINLSRVEQFFADFLSALELQPSARRLTLLDFEVNQPPTLFTEGRHLPIPPNVWFVGTANHDETTIGFADKTIDRAHVMELPRRTSRPRVGGTPMAEPAKLSFAALEQVFQEASATYASETDAVVKWLGEGKLAMELDRRFRVGWGNRLEDQARRFVPVVVAAGGSVGEAVDHLLVTRILRKIQDRHDVRASQLEELKKVLVADWAALRGSSTPVKSLALLNRELETKREDAA
jgi:hypothetical protein